MRPAEDGYCLSRRLRVDRPFGRRLPGDPSARSETRFALDGPRHEVNIRLLSAVYTPAHRERSPITMMMEHQTGPMSPNAIAQEAVDSVRSALERHVESLAMEPAPDLRAALHALALDARSKAVPPEHLLVTLKSIWQSLPSVEKARDHAEQTQVLQRVVTICIKEYFAE